MNTHTHRQKAESDGKKIEFLMLFIEYVAISVYRYVSAAFLSMYTSGMT